MSNARAHRAAWLAAIVVVALGFGIALVKVFNENLVFFY
ncbi:MAG TPA: cytochrome c biogenesis protein CcmE, partial [Limnobacter sp.]|nr:cytochrome c biogenesis protein CcmE [Limnobacter sp.]